MSRQYAPTNPRVGTMRVLDEGGILSAFPVIIIEFKPKVRVCRHGAFKLARAWTPAFPIWLADKSRLRVRRFFQTGKGLHLSFPSNSNPK